MRDGRYRIKDGNGYSELLPRRQEIGDVVTWTPRAWMDGDYPGARHTLTGVVIAVNEAHRHFTVEAQVGANRLRESFRFRGDT